MIHQLLSPDGVHPQIISSEIVSPLPCSSRLVHYNYITVCLFYPRTHFFHWLPWQMPHQRFQRFDLVMYLVYCNYSNLVKTRLSPRLKLALQTKISLQKRLK